MLPQLTEHERMAANAQTVFDAMVACGVDNAIRFNGATAAMRIAEEVFDNDFMSCIDKDISEIEEDFKTYAGLTVNQGQIRLHPGTKRQIKAFMQWVTNDQSGKTSSMTSMYSQSLSRSLV